MDKYYKKFSLFLVRNHKINENDSELYEYAIKVVIHDIINIITTIIIAFLFNMFKECFSIYFTFFMLRKFTGGLHAIKYGHCLFFSIVLMVLSLFIVMIFEKFLNHTMFINLLIIPMLIIWLFSPIENSNKKITKREKKVFKLISIIISMTLFVVALLLINYDKKISFSLGIGLVIDSALLILGYILEKQRRRKNETV